jgi:hypothetical protein
MHTYKVCSLGIYVLNLIPIMVWAGVVVNGVSINVTIEWGITTKYKVQITSFALKLKFHA